jgi:hypothetical protein
LVEEVIVEELVGLYGGVLFGLGMFEQVFLGCELVL